MLTRVDLFVLDLIVFFVTSSDGKESQMGSRGQHPGRRVEDHFAVASSTLDPLGEGAQTVSHCQSQEAVKVEGHCHYVHDSCACSGTEISASKPTRGACGSFLQDRKVAGCNQHVGQCRHGQERESCEISTSCASSSCGATCLRADRLDARIHRAGEVEISCRRGGSSLC